MNRRRLVRRSHRLRSAICVNGTKLESGGSATWKAGANGVNVVVTNGMSATAYHVTVTKS